MQYCVLHSLFLCQPPEAHYACRGHILYYLKRPMTSEHRSSRINLSGFLALTSKTLPNRQTPLLVHLFEQRMKLILILLTETLSRFRVSGAHCFLMFTLRHALSYVPVVVIAGAPRVYLVDKG